MAKQVFKLKIDSLFISNIKYMYFFAFGLTVIFAECYVFYDLSPLFLIVAMIMFPIIRYLLQPALEDLKIGGAGLLTIDTEKKYIQLDDRQKIAFSSINHLFVKHFAHSNISSSMIDSVVAILSANSELLISLKDKEPIYVNIQRKDTYNSLLYVLSRCEDVTLKLGDGIKAPTSASNSSLFFIVLGIVALAFVYWVYFLF